MNNNTKANTGSSESVNGQVNQEALDETLSEASSPPLLSPETQDIGQGDWDEDVEGTTRAPPKLLPMAETGSSPPTKMVKVQQPANEVPVASVKEGIRKKPKRMTPRRREIIAGFFLEVLANLGKYGIVGGRTWMKELLLRIRGESGRFNYVQVTDVANWLNNAEFKEDYDKLVNLQKGLQGTVSLASSASVQPLQNAEPIGSKEPVKIAPPPHQPAPFATAFAASAQVKSKQPEPASSNSQGIVGDDGITYQTHVPQQSTYYVNHMGLPILPADLWQHIKQEENQNQPGMQPNLFFQPGGILVQLPPSATSTTLYIHPTSWAAYVGKCNENGDEATGTNEQVNLGTVKQEKDEVHAVKNDKEDNSFSDFSGDQFMGFMGELTDAQD